VKSVNGPSVTRAAMMELANTLQHAARARAERMHALGQIVRHMTERLNVIGIFYDIEAMAISSRMVNVSHKQAELASGTWNAHEWDIR